MMPTAGTTDNNKKFWEIISTRYDDIVDVTIGEKLRPQVRERLGRERCPGRAVEFGCGTGYFTGTLAQVAGSVVATDLSDGMLGRARERLKGLGNVTLQKENCLKTSFPAGAFDLAFMALMVHLTENPMQALCEANRILKPGGVIIIANPDSSRIGTKDTFDTAVRFNANYGFAAEHFSKEEYEALVRNSRELTVSDLRHMLPAAGFEVTDLEVLEDGSDASNCAMDYVRAVKVSDAADRAAAAIKNYRRAETVIQVKDLCKNYGRFTAVFGVSFTVKQGEVFALLGPNGAGKTTIVEILELLKDPTRGMVTIFDNSVLAGVDVGNASMGGDREYADIKDRIGVLPQNFCAFDLLTVYENVDFFARMYSNPTDVERLIGELGLKEKRNALFRDLSGGLKRRVGIAIALAHDPEIVFLDEPTTGLDPRARRDVWAAIRALKERGKTVVLTTHYMDEAYNLADRVCILNKGSIVAQGSPEDLINEYGGGNVLVLRGCGAAEELAKAIPGGRADGNSVLVKLSGDGGMEGIAKAVEAVKKGGIDCKEIYVKKPTLEDVFLHLTGEKLAEGGS